MKALDESSATNRSGPRPFNANYGLELADSFVWSNNVHPVSGICVTGGYGVARDLKIRRIVTFQTSPCSFSLYWSGS